MRSCTLIKIKKTIKKLVDLYFVFLFIACIIVTILPWWPDYNLLIIPKYLLLFGPRWWLLLVLLIILLFWCFLSKVQLLILTLLVPLSFNYLDFQLPHLSKIFSFSSSQQKHLKLITYNIGGGGSKFELHLLVKYMDPDILLLQEARKFDLAKMFNSAYFSECISGLCILSKYPFKRTKTLDRKIFGGWGKFAVFYTIKTFLGEISLANVHFETPRTVLMSVIYGDPDQSLAQEMEENRQFEANLINMWAKNRILTLIGGDFNMPADENIFRQNFNFLKNAVEVKGFAFNRTKYTSWYGARIDHILYSNELSITSVKVVDLLKGDHRPLMATFIKKQ